MLNQAIWDSIHESGPHSDSSPLPGASSSAYWPGLGRNLREDDVNGTSREEYVNLAFSRRQDSFEEEMKQTLAISLAEARPKRPSTGAMDW